MSICKNYGHSGIVCVDVFIIPLRFQSNGVALKLSMIQQNNTLEE